MGLYTSLPQYNAPKKMMEPELCVLGEVFLDSIPTEKSELLSTKQVMKLVKRDQ